MIDRTRSSRAQAATTAALALLLLAAAVELLA